MDLDEKRQLIPEEDVQKYLANMSEIRLRISSVRQNLNANPFDVVSFESALLQIRKSLELIAFSSLASNKDGYESARGGVEKDWHAVRILKAVEAINPGFYPVPIDPDDDSGLLSLNSGFLTKAEFIKWYNLCGDYMHARNPFIEEQSKLGILALIPELIAKLELLLQEHLISLSGTDDKIWVSVKFEDKTKPVAMRFLHYLHKQT
jgi:hypothetical protein